MKSSRIFFYGSLAVVGFAQVACAAKNPADSASNTNADDSSTANSNVDGGTSQSGDTSSGSEQGQSSDVNPSTGETDSGSDDVTSDSTDDGVSSDTTATSGDESASDTTQDSGTTDSGESSSSDETTTDSTTTSEDSTEEVDPCANFESIVSKETFDTIFPLDRRNPAYTYEGMVEATKSYPEFATTGDCDTRKREIAAIFGNITREVGCLQFIEQIDKSTGPYCDSSRPYGCPAGREAYYGRGPIQLSWNYNYYTAGQALGLDLLNYPETVAEDPKVSWQTALWFWMTAGGDGGGNNPHNAITSGKGFGATISMINGWEECNGGNVGYAREAVTVRVCAYQAYTALLGTDVGPGDLNCGTPLNACPKGCMD